MAVISIMSNIKLLGLWNLATSHPGDFCLTSRVVSNTRLRVLIACILRSKCHGEDQRLPIGIKYEIHESNML